LRNPRDQILRLTFPLPNDTVAYRFKHTSSQQRTAQPTMLGGDDQLGSARVKLTNVWATMKGVFARAWDHKSACFFVGSVILMHAFGDELAV
jgi:hypothetical protein